MWKITLTLTQLTSDDAQQTVCNMHSQILYNWQQVAITANHSTEIKIV